MPKKKQVKKLPSTATMTQCARALNVSRNHLYLVLDGKRVSKTLMANIEAICPHIIKNA